MGQGVRTLWQGATRQSIGIVCNSSKVEGMDGGRHHQGP